MNIETKKQYLINRQYKKQRAEEIRRWIIVGLLLLITVPPCLLCTLSLVFPVFK